MSKLVFVRDKVRRFSKVGLVSVMRRDRLGRRRQPEQERGLRPTQSLPPGWDSRAIRVAMSDRDWRRWQALVEQTSQGQTSRAQAIGAILSRMLDVIESVDANSSARDASSLRIPWWVPEPTSPINDWLDWESEKSRRLLRLVV